MSEVAHRPGLLPPQTPDQKKACLAIELVMDKEGRTAIVLSQTKTEVEFIPLVIEGLFVTYTSPSVFRARFPVSQKDPSAPRSLQGTTVAAAARCYVTHATYCGAEPAAVAALERLVPITKQEKERIIMAKKTDKPATENKDPKSKSGKPAKPAAKKKDAKSNKAEKPAKEKRVSASSTFRELIMQGKLTDDQIFAEVQKRHADVGDEKRSYVAWYRNDLRKKGENPPAPKKDPKAKAA